MDIDNITVHIWELPEKTNEIDKSNDYTMIHDGTRLKKSTIEKLYEYFKQDYKIENMVKYFETLMETENQKYESLYAELELSTESYENIVKELENVFTSNRDNIRSLETALNQMSYDTIELLETFENIESRNNNLSESLDNINDDITSLQIRNNTIRTTISKVNNSIKSINNNKSIIVNNNKYITESIPNISDHMDINITDKGDILTKNINDEYDKIVAIIDYYHHG